MTLVTRLAVASVSATLLACASSPAPLGGNPPQRNDFQPLGRVAIRSNELPIKIGHCNNELRDYDPKDKECTILVKVTVGSDPVNDPSKKYQCYIMEGDVTPRVMLVSQGNGDRNLRWRIVNDDGEQGQFRFASINDTPRGIHIVDHTEPNFPGFKFNDDELVNNGEQNKKPKVSKWRAEVHNGKGDRGPYQYQYNIQVLYRARPNDEWLGCQPYDPVIVNRG